MKSRVSLGQQQLPRSPKTRSWDKLSGKRSSSEVAAVSRELHRSCDDFRYEAASALLVDPLGFDAGDSNLYRYINNAPTDATDPSGELPFSVTPDFKSVRQKGDDCAFAATAVSLAFSRPGDISRMIEENQDCTYSVTLPGQKQPIVISLRAERARLGEGQEYSDSNGNWLELLEIAAGRCYGAVGKLTPYQYVQGPAMVSSWIRILTGHGSTSNFTFRRTTDTLYSIIKGALDKKKIICALSLCPGRNTSGIENWHWYAILGCGSSRFGYKYVTLFNPWGSNTAKYGAGDREVIRGNGDPEFSMRMDEFKKYFSMITYED